MLQTLSIKNVAIIDSAEISFREGLNVLSGETGAGKSIVLEAISLLLGSRANSELVRTGCDEAVIEGLFDVSDIPWIGERLERLGFSSESSELLIKRIVHRAGRHRIYINGALATLAILSELCEGLIDLCGQHEHQSLTKPAMQLELLDRYGGLSQQSQRLVTKLTELKSLKAEQRRLEEAEAERTRRADFLRFQIDELRGAGLEIGEDESLHAEKQLLQSAETRLQTGEAMREILENDGEGALNAIRAALSKARALNQLDERVAPLREGLERAQAELEEVDLSLIRYLGSIDLNMERLESVQERLALLADLRRKYGTSIEEMLATLNQLETDFAALGKTEERQGALNEQIRGIEHELLQLGVKLSAARRKAAEIFSDSVTGELKDLRMGDARFQVSFEHVEALEDWSASGPDLVSYLVQTNLGEPARPLGKIASGGELSRLMLAVRRVIADKGGIGVYLFDEIDAGIGGQTAFQVGKKLKSVASYNQVICITHLPQVASFADHHLVVRKSTAGKRTVTQVVELSAKERKEELARMLGGPELTKKSLETAAELIDLAR